MLGSKLMNSYHVVLLFAIFLVLSCEKKTTIEDFDEAKFGYDYFPLEVGKYWTYHVDSTIYDDEGATVVNSSSLIREEIVEKFEDLVGDEIYRIERSWRDSDSSSWKVTDVWATYKDKDRAYRTEENLKFIKFVFPALEGSRWDGNIFFDESTVITVLGESLKMFKGWDDYEILELDVAEELGGQNYQEVATVLQTDDEEGNTVERRFALEKYARGVGLIYKEYIILDTQSQEQDKPWLEKAEKGFVLKQTLIEHN